MFEPGIGDRFWMVNREVQQTFGGIGGCSTKSWRALGMLVLCLCTCPWGSLGAPCDKVPAVNINRVHHPQILIGIGSPKSGTTFIYNALLKHPKIVKPRFKELHFFDNQFEPTQAAYEKYFKFWGGKEKWENNEEKNQVLLEITPRYLGMYDVPCNIKHFVPDAKFIVTLRHPADRAMSHITMHREACIRERRKNRTDPLPCCQDSLFDMPTKIAVSIENMKASRQQCLTISSQDPWHGCSNDKLKPIDRDVYSTQIAHWFKVFPPSQFLFINANELFQDPVKQLNRILEFVGLPTDWDLDQHVDDVQHYKAHVNIIDPDETTIRNMIEKAFEEPLADLYRLFQKNGIKFSPLTVDPNHNQETNVRPLSDLQAECCKGGCPFPPNTYNTKNQNLKSYKIIDPQFYTGNTPGMCDINWFVLAIFPVCAALIYWVRIQHIKAIKKPRKS